MQLKLSSRWNEYRQIAERYVYMGDLILITPAHFGEGSASQTTDMPVLRDPISQKPMLLGSSIAGALRAYINEWLLGYEYSEEAQKVKELFGNTESDQSNESWIIFDDSFANQSSTEYRTGVKIDPVKRTVHTKDERGQLYDSELISAGTVFPIRIEVAIPDNPTLKDSFLQLVGIGLVSLMNGEISLGARKRRGYGECVLKNLKVYHYPLKNPQALIAWLKDQPFNEKTVTDIIKDLNLNLPSDKRERFIINADFHIATSLMIRSISTNPKEPDCSHIKSNHKEKKNVPILPGTSLAGALRARALRIAKIRVHNDEQAKKIIEELFGPEEIPPVYARSRASIQPHASRIVVREREVIGRNDLIQSRIRIDRFTGGVYEGALFEEQPVWGGGESWVNINIEIRKPKREHIALALLLLKDLWTSDLPVGGESSIGRGRLKGNKAEIKYYNGKLLEWKIEQNADGTLNVQGDSNKLEAFLKEA